MTILEQLKKNLIDDSSEQNCPETLQAKYAPTPITHLLHITLATSSDSGPRCTAPIETKLKLHIIQNLINDAINK